MIEPNLEEKKVNQRQDLLKLCILSQSFKRLVL